MVKVFSVRGFTREELMEERSGDASVGVHEVSRSRSCLNTSVACIKGKALELDNVQQQ